MSRFPRSKHCEGRSGLRRHAHDATKQWPREVSLLLQPPDSGLTRKRHQGRVGTLFGPTRGWWVPELAGGRVEPFAGGPLGETPAPP